MTDVNGAADGDGDSAEIVTLGMRSLAIWTAGGEPTFDERDDLADGEIGRCSETIEQFNHKKCQSARDAGSI